MWSAVGVSDVRLASVASRPCEVVKGRKEFGEVGHARVEPL